MEMPATEVTGQSVCWRERGGPHILGLYPLMAYPGFCHPKDFFVGKPANHWPHLQFNYIL